METYREYIFVFQEESWNPQHTLKVPCSSQYLCHFASMFLNGYFFTDYSLKMSNTYIPIVW